MTQAPDEPASPACLAHEADDTYMGFASRAEITAFLTALAEVEGGGVDYADMLRRMLPRIRDDVLHAELKAKLDAINGEESGT